MYAATRVADGAGVAIKILRAGALDQNGVQRFLREIRALRQIEHPHIVRLLDHAAPDETLCWLALERLHGHTLRQWVHSRARSATDADAETVRRAQDVDPKAATAMLDNAGSSTVRVPVPPALQECEYIDQILRIGAQLATGLEALHASGVLHRDLNPGNVMIEADGRAVLMDFGLSRGVEDETITMSRELLGTLGFVPPEAVSGETATARSDVYALGATLYAALAGQPPYQGATAAQTLRAIESSPPPPLDSLNPAVSRDCARVLTRAMAHDPRDRHATAAELRADLEALVEGGSIAHPILRHALLRRARKWVLRAGAVAATGALAVLAVLAGIGSPVDEIRLAIQRGATAEALVRLSENRDPGDRDRILREIETAPEAGRDEPTQRFLAAARGHGLIRLAIAEHERLHIWSCQSDAGYGGPEPLRGAEFAPLAERPFVSAPQGSIAKVVLWIDDPEEAWGPGDPATVSLLLRPPVVNPDEPTASLELQGLPGWDDQIPQWLFAPLADGREYWAVIPAGRYEPVLITKTPGQGMSWGKQDLLLPASLAVARCELSAHAASNYLGWVQQHSDRLPWFAHPDEPDGQLTAERIQSELRRLGQLPRENPALVNYWLAFRVAGYLRSRLPSMSMWTHAAQSDTGERLRALRRAWAQDFDRPRKYRDVRSTTEDCGDLLRIQDMSGHAPEWTTSSIHDLKARLCPVRRRESDPASPNLRPDDWISGSLHDLAVTDNDQIGLRLFRFRLEP